MDQNQRTRGRSRGSGQPRAPARLPGAQPPRMPNIQPRQPNANAPRQPNAYAPRQPAQGQNQMGAQVPRVAGQQSVRQQHPNSSREVEQVTQEVSSLTTGDALVPIGRGAVRGRRVLDMESECNKYYRAPRPASSLTGKEGNIGTPINLVANYFPISTYTNWTLYQYEVVFSPEEDRINVKRGLLGTHREKLGAFIFDGLMLFSSTMYDSRELTLTSKRNPDGQIIIITVTFKKVLETNDLIYIQVFNILLRNCLKHLNLVLIGRDFFDPVAKIDIPSYKLQLWPGYETTIGMFDSGLLLRAEIMTKVMREETVFDFFRECLQNGGNQCMDNFKAAVIGTVVLTRYNNKTYKIDDIDDMSTPKSTFQSKGNEMSYIEYYKTKYNITIRDGNQPMLVSKKKKSIFDDTVQLIYLVPELCSLTGMTQAMRDNFNLMKTVCQYTRVFPMGRVQRYNNFMQRLQTTPETIAAFNQWNLGLNDNLVRFNGRILGPQKIYSNTSFIDSGTEADWTRHIRSLPMFMCATMQQWAVVFPNRNEAEVRTFIKQIISVANGMHFKIPLPFLCPINISNITNYPTSLEQIINTKNPSLILCVIPSHRSDLYSLIKRKLTIDRAVPSQVVVYKNVQNNNPSVCTKIAIQLNCKLGGAPWKVAIPSEGMMIVGFDVCHDKQNKNKSYGALVATINDSHTKFYSSVQQHPSGDELSTHFAASIAGALHAYNKLNKKLPSMVVIYRDGVGDGQISYVHRTEVKMVKKTLNEFYGKEVPLAFIIVKKRISTRFFSSPIGSSEYKNPPPGTVVDNTITDPTMYDFFLVSQHVKIGTVTPTHYNVIVDTLTNWSPSRMQMMTFKLAHMYYNWSGTVRVPAHCQLAHKLAYLTAQSLNRPPNAALNELLYYL